MRTAKCMRRGCQEIAHARRLCRYHYGVARRAGKLPPLVIVGYDKTDEERFFRFVVEGEGGCWQWTGSKSDTGYGSFKPRDRSASNSHRWSYQFFVGEIPTGLVIDHLCRNRACVNPSHMDVVTPGVNTKRGMAGESTRRRAAALTHCPHGHEKTEANVYRFFDAKRSAWASICRPCQNARLRRRKEARRDVS